MNASVGILESENSNRFVNQHAAEMNTAYPEALRNILSLDAYKAAEKIISAWPGYVPTSLRDLPGLAARLGVARVYYKDESTRFGLGSFKALGGAYAVWRLLLGEVSRRTKQPGLKSLDLTRPEIRELVADITVTCATDGNHGKSVAWGAQRFGCRCIIYIHQTVSRGREQAIAQYGADVVRVAGNYDDAVKQAALDAEKNGYFVVSDTSYPGYLDVPRNVMQGYSIMVQEAIDQIGDRPAPTHVFIQGGVGGLAAAVCAHFWERKGRARPRLIVVEPDRAACLFESARAGHPVAVAGSLDTIMAGLACGEVSLLAWDVLSAGANAFMTITDDDARYVMCLLAEGSGRDEPVVAGESAVAGVAGCLLAMNDPALCEQLGLDRDSRVLFFSSEGDTDPTLYRNIVGRSADDVRNGVRK